MKYKHQRLIALLWYVVCIGTVALGARSASTQFHQPQICPLSSESGEILKPERSRQYMGRSLADWRAELATDSRRGGWRIQPWIPLGRNGDIDALDVLIELLTDPSPVVRWKAIACIGWLKEGAAPATPHLIVALRDPDFRVRMAAAASIGDVGTHSHDAALALRTALGDHSCRVRFRAAVSLWHITQVEEPVIQTMTDLLNPPGRDEFDLACESDIYLGITRCDAADFLGELGPVAHAVVPGLVHCLTEAHSKSLRMSCAKALGKIGIRAKAAIPALQCCMNNDPSDSCRMAAAVSLWKVTEDSVDSYYQEVHDIFVKVAFGTNLTTLEDAVTCLAVFGEHAKGSLPLLLEVYGHQSDPLLKRRIYAALAAIDLETTKSVAKPN